MNNTNTNKSFDKINLDWELIQSELKLKLGIEVYESWIKKIDLLEEFNNYILLTVPTRFIRDWITSRYLDQILQTIKKHKKQIVRIEFKITEKKNDNIEKLNDLNQINKTQKVSFIKDSHLQYSRIDPNKRFENFLIGSSNKIAFEASLKVSENISHYNPLYIYGGVGLGKTHLLNSIGHEMSRNKKVMFISAERFMYQFVKSIKSNDMVKFKEYFRNTDVLLIDDIQFMNGKEAMQEEFFHTFNALLDRNNQMILTCDKYPKEIDGLEERLKSRLGWGLPVVIDPPELETRAAVLLSKASSMGVSLPNDCAIYIAQRIRSNIRELEGALKRVVANARFTNQDIDLALVKEALKDLFVISAKMVSVENIQKTVAEYYNIKLSDLLSKRRSRSITRPRQMAMALTKELTNHSLPEIGESFNGRDHTTVLHACKKIAELRKENPSHEEDYRNLNRALTN